MWYGPFSILPLTFSREYNLKSHSFYNDMLFGEDVSAGQFLTWILKLISQNAEDSEL